MKKIIVFCIVCITVLFAMPVFADAGDAGIEASTDGVYPTLTVPDADQVKSIKTVTDNFNKLFVGVDKIAIQVWDASIQNQKQEAIADVIFCAIMFLSGFVALHFMPKLLHKPVPSENKSTYNNDMEIYRFLSFWIPLIWTAIWCICLLSESIDGYVQYSNPSFYALKAIFRIIHN